MRTDLRPDRAAALPAWTLATCYGLVAQFFLGTIANLYVRVPAQHPGVDARAYFAGAFQSVLWAAVHAEPLLLAHTVLGLALAVNSLALVVAAALAGEAAWIWITALGASFVVGAGFNGASFLTYGHDFSSLIMAGLFGLSLVAYLTGLYLASDRR